MSDGGDVNFDFGGSLRLARKLWADAARVQRIGDARNNSFDEAAVKWAGPHFDEMQNTRMPTMESNVSASVRAMRAEAETWAAAWQEALTTQNQRERARATTTESAERGGMEKFGDFFVGDDSNKQVPELEPVGLPHSPYFSPVGGLAVFTEGADGWNVSYVDPATKFGDGVSQGGGVGGGSFTRPSSEVA